MTVMPVLEVAPARPCIVWLLLRSRIRLPGTWLFGTSIIWEMREVQCGHAAGARRLGFSSARIQIAHRLFFTGHRPIAGCFNRSLTMRDQSLTIH